MFLEAEDLEFDAEVVRSALSNPCDRRILAEAQQRPVAAKTILERTSIAKSTLYRRIDRLHREGLLRVVTATIEDGHRIDRYRCPLSAMGMRVEEGEIHLDWTLAADADEPEG